MNSTSTGKKPRRKWERHQKALGIIAVSFGDLSQEEIEEMFDLAEKFYHQEFAGKRRKPQFGVFVGLLFNLSEEQFPSTAVLTK